MQNDCGVFSILSAHPYRTDCCSRSVAGQPNRWYAGYYSGTAVIVLTESNAIRRRRARKRTAFLNRELPGGIVAEAFAGEAPSCLRAGGTAGANAREPGDAVRSCPRP